MSSQSLIGFAILVVFTAAIWGMAGQLVMYIIPWGNGFLNGYAQSADSFNTAYLLIQIIVASPFVALLLWGWDHLGNSQRNTGGNL